MRACPRRRSGMNGVEEVLEKQLRNASQPQEPRDPHHDDDDDEESVKRMKELPRQWCDRRLAQGVNILHFATEDGRFNEEQYKVACSTLKNMYSMMRCNFPEVIKERAEKRERWSDGKPVEYHPGEDVFEGHYNYFSSASTWAVFAAQHAFYKTNGYEYHTGSEDASNEWSCEGLRSYFERYSGREFTIHLKGEEWAHTQTTMVGASALRGAHRRMLKDHLDERDRVVRVWKFGPALVQKAKTFAYVFRISHRGEPFCDHIEMTIPPTWTERANTPRGRAEDEAGGRHSRKLEKQRDKQLREEERKRKSPLSRRSDASQSPKPVVVVTRRVDSVNEKRRAADAERAQKRRFDDELTQEMESFDKHRSLCRIRSTSLDNQKLVDYIDSLARAERVRRERAAWIEKDYKLEMEVYAAKKKQYDTACAVFDEYDKAIAELEEFKEEVDAQCKFTESLLETDEEEKEKEEEFRRYYPNAGEWIEERLDALPPDDRALVVSPESEDLSELDAQRRKDLLRECRHPVRSDMIGRQKPGYFDALPDDVKTRYFASPPPRPSPHLRVREPAEPTKRTDIPFSKLASESAGMPGEAEDYRCVLGVSEDDVDVIEFKNVMEGADEPSALDKWVLHLLSAEHTKALLASSRSKVKSGNHTNQSKFERERQTRHSKAFAEIKAWKELHARYREEQREGSQAEMTRLERERKEQERKRALDERERWEEYYERFCAAQRKATETNTVQYIAVSPEPLDPNCGPYEAIAPLPLEAIDKYGRDLRNRVLKKRHVFLNVRGYSRKRDKKEWADFLEQERKKPLMSRRLLSSTTKRPDGSEEAKPDYETVVYTKVVKRTEHGTVSLMIATDWPVLKAGEQDAQIRVAKKRDKYHAARRMRQKKALSRALK